VALGVDHQRVDVDTHPAHSDAASRALIILGTSHVVGQCGRYSIAEFLGSFSVGREYFALSALQYPLVASALPTAFIYCATQFSLRHRLLRTSV